MIGIKTDELLLLESSNAARRGGTREAWNVDDGWLVVTRLGKERRQG